VDVDDELDQNSFFKRTEKFNSPESVTYNIVRRVKGKVAPVLNKAPRHDDVWDGGGIPPRILNLGTRWR
jgi:hypothetical protein